MNLEVSDLMKDAGIPFLPEQLVGHEDNVGENVLVPLLKSAGYDGLGDITRKPALSHAIVGQSRAPDYGVYRYSDEPKLRFGMVCDVKRPDVPLAGKLVEKLAGYCGLAGASYGVATNGIKLLVIRPKNGVVDWEFEDGIPTKSRLQAKIGRKTPLYPLPHIIYANRIVEEFTESTIDAIAKRCHDIDRSRKGMMVPERLYEFSKLLITRIMDERRFAEGDQKSLFLTKLQRLRN